MSLEKMPRNSLNMREPDGQGNRIGGTWQSSERVLRPQARDRRKSLAPCGLPGCEHDHGHNCCYDRALPLRNLQAMPSALICGSLAYDTIMVFPDQFKNHILPDKVHILNVSFLVPRMRREFGGCAGNIAYNMNLLGADPIPMATVGQDFGPYREWFTEHGIRLDRIRELPELFTAQAFITTDLDDNQITAFHPGAMLRSHENHVRDVEGATFGIVAPDGRDAMLQHASEFKAAGIPFIFDPGQALPLFNGEEFRHFIEQADYVVVNDYESSLLRERTGWDE